MNRDARATGVVRQSAKAEGSVRAWWGSRRDLEQLTDVVADLVDEMRQRAMVEFENAFTQEYPAFNPNDDWQAETRSRRLEQLDQKWRYELAVTDTNGVETTGPFTMVGDIDLRAIQSLVIKAPASYYSEIQIRVTMQKRSRKGRLRGKVDFSVASTDPGWTTKAHGEIQRELNKAAPPVLFPDRSSGRSCCRRRF